MKKVLAVLVLVFSLFAVSNYLEFAADPDDPGVGGNSIEEAADPDDPGVGGNSIEV